MANTHQPVGTYSIQPRHIATRLPRHIEEEDLEIQDANFERPLTTPTASSYLIQRIKLAEVARHIIDTIPLGASGADSVRYEDIIALDGRFAAFLRELPPFFQFDPTNDARFHSLYTERPSILVQKYTTNMICQTRRCRLHQPFLVRGFTSPAYAHSRNVCLESARKVIAIKHQLDRQKSMATSLLAMSGIHHHMFFACVALVMDLCFNMNGNGDRHTNSLEAAQRLAEVKDALSVLEDAKDRSPVAKKFLDSLMDVMRKHKVRLIDGPAAESQQRSTTPFAAFGALANGVAHGVPQAASVPNGLPSNSQIFEDNFDAMQIQHNQHDQSDFDEIWQSYIEHGPNFDAPDWDELFLDLQMQLK